MSSCRSSSRNRGWHTIGCLLVYVENYFTGHGLFLIIFIFKGIERIISWKLIPGIGHAVIVWLSMHVVAFYSEIFSISRTWEEGLSSFLNPVTCPIGPVKSEVKCLICMSLASLLCACMGSSRMVILGFFYSRGWPSTWCTGLSYWLKFIPFCLFFLFLKWVFLPHTFHRGIFFFFLWIWWKPVFFYLIILFIRMRSSGTWSIWLGWLGLC